MYKTIGIEMGLNGKTLDRFIRYMIERWSYVSAGAGYTREWAIRFRENREYTASDLAGQKVLREIDKASYSLQD